MITNIRKMQGDNDDVFQTLKNERMNERTNFILNNNTKTVYHKHKKKSADSLSRIMRRNKLQHCVNAGQLY